MRDAEGETSAARFEPPVSRPAVGGVLLVVLGALVTGSSASLLGLANVSGPTAAFFRCGYALALLGPLALFERRRATASLGWPVIARAAGGGVALAGDLIVWDQSIKLLGAGLSTVVQDTQVLFVAAAGWLLFRESITVGTLALVPVILGGVALIAGAGGSSGSNPTLGTALGIVSAIAYAGFILSFRAGRDQALPGARQLFVVTLAATALSGAVGSLTGTLVLTPEWPSAGWLALAAVLVQVFGWSVLSRAMAHLSTVHLSIGLLLQPVAALAFAAIALGDYPSALQLVGTVAVIGSVTGAVYFEGRRIPTKPQLGASPPSR